MHTQRAGGRVANARAGSGPVGEPMPGRRQRRAAHARAGAGLVLQPGAAARLTLSGSSAMAHARTETGPGRPVERPRRMVEVRCHILA